MAIDKEAADAPVVEGIEDLHEYGGKEGYVVDAADAAHANLKRAPDGHTILLPQPSGNPDDP